ncbi:hypothetical protein RBA41_22475 [Massilia sp. CCM 9210]|uniref:hypothetical protein n=1 Tax=Massilia scottii TaxID=3057166 RepID=UPI002796DD61|nr:hypothetical protein [Massilia sp. CCM 9210]MDQ1816068.1 hypothetical protein [Massilia sp. CCM 9210]
MSDRVSAAFERSIGDENSGWHEYNLQVAAEVLSEFSTLDWGNLRAVVLSKPAYWQERCAESVGCIESDESVRTLIILLGSPYKSVSGIVASELDNLSVQLPRVFEHVLRELLTHLEASKSPRSADVQRLINHLR